MKNTLEAIVLPQLDELVARFDQLRKQSKHADCSDIDDGEASEFLSAAVSAIVHVAGPKSDHATRSQAIITSFTPNCIACAIPFVGGAVKALRNDVAKGYLSRVEELVHAGLFADFLEMAEHLLVLLPYFTKQPVSRIMVAAPRRLRADDY